MQEDGKPNNKIIGSRQNVRKQGKLYQQIRRSSYSVHAVRSQAVKKCSIGNEKGRKLHSIALLLLDLILYRQGNPSNVLGVRSWGVHKHLPILPEQGGRFKNGTKQVLTHPSDTSPHHRPQHKKNGPIYSVYKDTGSLALLLIASISVQNQISTVCGRGLCLRMYGKHALTLRVLLGLKDLLHIFYTYTFLPRFLHSNTSHTC